MKPDVSRETSPKVSIVILNYDQLDLVTQNVANLVVSVADVPTEVILVDNGSPHPASLQALAESNKLRYVRNDVGLSFAAANNAAIAVARGEWILMLNDDTLAMDDGWLKKLVEKAESKPGLGVAGIKLIGVDGTVQHAGVYFSQYRQPHHLFMGTEANDPRTEGEREVQAVTGGCMLFRRETWERLGGLRARNERFEYHYEDVDFCLRAKAIGLSTWYFGDVSIVHYGSMTAGHVIPKGHTYDHLRALVEDHFLEIEHDDWKVDLPEGFRKVMVAIPLADSCRWRFRQLMNMVGQLDYWKRNVKIAFATANCGDDFRREISEWAKLNAGAYDDVLMPSAAEWKDGKMASVYYNRNKLRDIFLKSDCDLIFFVDADVSMERRTVRRLIEVMDAEKADAAAGTYPYKLEGSRAKPMLFATSVPRGEYVRFGFKEQVQASRQMAQRVVGLGNFRVAPEMLDGKVHEAGAVNMGCTMVSRRAMEAIPFNPKPCYGTEDLSWFADAQEKGFKLVVDTDLKLFHLDENGLVYCQWNCPPRDDAHSYPLRPAKEALDVVH